jgi:diacylglycerol diphosphate phosphatase / phosphatidate phosphatase
VVLSLAITGSFTQVTKITVGRPRPGMDGLYPLILHLSEVSILLLDIIDRCQPSAGSVDPPFGLTSSAICRQTNAAILIDGFRSFPSGHASS